MQLKDSFKVGNIIDLNDVMSTFSKILDLGFDLPVTKKNVDALNFSVVKKLREIQCENLSYEQCFKRFGVKYTPRVIRLVRYVFVQDVLGSLTDIGVIKFITTDISKIQVCKLSDCHYQVVIPILGGKGSIRAFTKEGLEDWLNELWRLSE